MIKSKLKLRLKRHLVVITAMTMIITALPVIGGKAKKVNAAEVNPLTTVWKTANIGTHTDEGTFAYDATNKCINLTGAGTVFGKDTNADDLFYAYFDVKGKTTVVAKMSPDADNSSATSGMLGIIEKNDPTDPESMAAGVYIDYDKKSIRLGRHGGASNLSMTDITLPYYIKLVFENGKVSSTIASDINFETVLQTKSSTDAKIDPKTVGFFATAGLKAVFSDVKVTSEYNEDGKDYKKVVFDSAMGELIPQFIKSSDKGGKYTEATSFSSEVDGNILKVTAVADGKDKGTIRENKNIDYMLFPMTNENYTIKADVTPTQISTTTDKVGIFLGEFAFYDNDVRFSTIQLNKNKKACAHYTKAENSDGTGSPSVEYEIGQSYTMVYQNNENGKAFALLNASGLTVCSNLETPNACSNYTSSLLNGIADKQYGLAFAGITVDVSNITIYDEDGFIVYDQNDYYKVKGTAPVVTEITKNKVSDDRSSIELEWTYTAGEGNQQYVIQVSKDGAAYTAAGTSKTNTFSYTPAGDGTYKFKVYGKAGESVSEPKESEAVEYVKPLEAPQLTVVGKDAEVEVTFTEVAGATGYELYRTKMNSDEYVKIKEFTTVESYTDTDVVNEYPYYYYVIAVNATNKSNPSEAMQALPTKGHEGTYEHGSEAAVITVISKSNDTVLDNKADISLKADRKGTFTYKSDLVDETSKSVNADEKLDLSFDLKDGRNTVEIVFTDEGGKQTIKKFNFVSNPEIDLVVDSAFTGNDGDVVDGHKTYKTINAALKSVPADNSEAVVIFIKNGTYRERLVITTPYISLLGEDAQKTKIVENYCVANHKATGMWDRNTVYVDSTADYFTAENLTIENDFAYNNGSDQQADALCIVADNTFCENIRLIGFQDTLLTNTRVKDDEGKYLIKKQTFDKCYITGNVDFIYGGGQTLFSECDIVGRYTPDKSDGCFSAPNTVNTIPYGFVYVSCNFTSEEGIAAGSYRLARPWGADASSTYINCYMGNCLLPTAYGDMSGNSYKNARFSEFMTYGEGFYVNNDRPQLSPEETLDFITTVVNDFKYLEMINYMYLAKADYSEVDKAIEAAAALIKDDYEDFSAVEAAVNAVVRNYPSSKQAQVDEMAAAINDAIKGLKLKEQGASSEEGADVQTADAAPIGIFLLLMVSSLLLLFAMKRKNVIKL